MRLWTKIVVPMVLVAAVPLGIAGSLGLPARSMLLLLALAALLAAGTGLWLARAVDRRARTRDDAVRELSRRLSLLAPFVDASVAAQGARLGGEEKQVSILLGDMRDFTRMSSALPADATVRVLNAYFSLYIDVVHHFGGVVDKIMGDAILAFFGETPAGEDFRARAVKAVVYMKVASRVLGKYLREREDLGAPGDIVAREFGFAVTSGPAIVGNIGSPRRMDYTVCGPVVNLAARLEGLARRGEVILDPETARAAEAIVNVRALSQHEESVVPSVVVSLRPEQIPVLRAYMAHLFGRDFALEHLVPAHLNDPAARSHAAHAAVERLQEFAASSGALFESAPAAVAAR